MKSDINIIMDYTYLNEVLTKAEQTEKLARELRDQNSDGLTQVAEDETRKLFDASWRGYHDVEDQVREEWNNTNSIQSCLLLAQTLMDIHIHPNSGLVRDSKMLWEAQYLWLHLYYQTGNPSFFDQAKLCDSIRHATVTAIA